MSNKFMILSVWLLFSFLLGCSNSYNNDYDSDGLSDEEETTLGTNYKLVDSDFDGLTDYQEIYQTKTDPINENTDNDRYNDKIDKSPLETNSAEIEVKTQEQTTSLSDLVDVAVEIGTNYENPIWWISVLSKEPVQEITISITNTGDDYTDYVSFDVVTYTVVISHEIEDDFLVCSKETKLFEGQIASETFLLENRIESGQSIQETISAKVETINHGVEFPEKCNLILCSCETTYGYSIENVEYEHFEEKANE